MPPADDCPDAVFVEDTVVMFRNVAVITRPGADARKPEIVDVEKIVEDLGCSINRIHAPGTLDGGDVLKVGDTVYVGRGGRTNGEGIRQLRAILEPLGAHGRRGAADEGAAPEVGGHRAARRHRSSATRRSSTTRRSSRASCAVPEESGAHVVLLGGAQLLMAADCPRSAALFADLGYEPVIVDISEFEKLEGCVTCLSVRVRGLAP